MLTSLDFAVEFANTGKKLSGSHNFEAGLTAITGANEAGKSLRIEMIRYALWGSKALRAEAKTYKSLSAKLVFALNGATFSVQRAGNKVDLLRNKLPIATGTKPVNDAIIDLFGYDMEVFDVTNACLQGDVEALTKKTPAERKRMVDRTIGLDAIDRVIAGVNEDTVATKKAMETLQNQVIQQHTPPVALSITDSLETLEERSNVLAGKLQRRQYLRGLIDAAKAPEPVAEAIPPEEVISETIEELQAQAEAVAVEFAGLEGLRQQVEKYETLSGIFEGKDTALIQKYLDEDYAQKWNLYKRWVAAKPQIDTSHYTEADLDFLSEGLNLKVSRSKHASNLFEIDCPSCQHHFEVNRHTGKPESGDPEFDQFDWAKYDQLVASVLGGKEQGINTARMNLEKTKLYEAMEAVAEPDLVEDSSIVKSLQPLIDPWNKLQGFDLEGSKLKLQDADTTFREVRYIIDSKIKLKQTQEIKELKYEREVEAYRNYLIVQAEHQAEIQDLLSIDEAYATVKDQISQVRAYQQLLSEYNAKQQAQSNALEAFEELKASLETLVAVKKSLQELKPKVKSHLLPSLNSVASSLLFQMTDGARTEIVVDEDFDVQVDKQPVNTLSGSAKAAVNLALRIALSTVLTNKVFSVFLADEIDAAMNKERAEYTAACLKNLSGTIGQIVLVSHRDPEADHHIQL